MYLSYHAYSYIDYIAMHFLNKFSLDNDVILVHQKLGQKIITLEDFINLDPLFQETFIDILIDFLKFCWTVRIGAIMEYIVR